MKVHAIQTGFVRIKSAQVEGHGHGLARRLAIFTDRSWIEWLPTYAWVIDHREGIIVVDTAKERIFLKLANRFIPMSVGKLRFASTVKRKSGRSYARWASGRAM
jgi:hypothetical protein